RWRRFYQTAWAGEEPGDRTRAAWPGLVPPTRLRRAAGPGFARAQDARRALQSLPQGAASGREGLLDQLDEVVFRVHADHGAHDLAAPEQDHGRDALDPVLRRGLPGVVDVELGHLELLGVLARQLVHHRRELAAGAAPRRPEVDQRELGRL